jgi:chromosome segregation ATPase
MESYDHTNGGSQTDTASHVDGSSEIVAAIHSDGDTHAAPSDLKEAVASIGVRLNENLQALSIHLGNADRLYDERAQQIAGMQDQVVAIQQELQGVQNFVRGLPQEIQTGRQQCEGKLQGLEQLLVSGAQTVAGIGQQLAATTQTLDDKAGQISHLEISVAALIRDASKMATVETAIGELNQKGTELAATVEELGQRSRSLKRLTVLTSATALILAVVVGMQMLGGWPAVARYVALWTSSLI